MLAKQLASLRSRTIRSFAGRVFLAEMLGTFLLVAFGDGSVAQAVTTNAASGTPLNSYLSINWGFFCGITFGVYVSGGISGGHINPAVSLAMAFIGRTAWRLVPVYFAAQYIGAFLASAVVYGAYWPGIDAGNYSVFGGIWASKPYAFTTASTGFFDQVFGTFLLVLIVMALTDAKNMGPNKGFVPVLVGLAVFGVGLAFGTNAGFAINPARDLAPRIFEAILFGAEPFSNGNFYFWIPVIGPHIGAIIGAFVYLVVIEMHHPGNCVEENVEGDDSSVNSKVALNEIINEEDDVKVKEAVDSNENAKGDSDDSDSIEGIKKASVEDPLINKEDVAAALDTVVNIDEKMTEERTEV